jgi:hypothetical protein
MIHEQYSTLRRSHRGGLELQRIVPGVLLGHRLAPLVVGAALAAEGRLVAVEVERLLVLAEPRHVLGQVPGRLGHEVAEVAEHLAAHLLVLVVLGLLELLAQLGIQIPPRCSRRRNQSMWLMPPHV